jgi:oligopeptide/dipeptide ABC transporter ATP-binding protein
MRQRVVAAIALACQPSLLIADEPTTALDVTVEAAFLDLLTEIQERFNLGIIFVTHDFGVVSRVCDRVAVMYAGRIVEEGTTRQIFDDPRHPYTSALIDSVPDVRDEVDWLTSIPGSPPPLFDRPSGCAFRTRCELFRELGEPENCVTELPAAQLVDGQRRVACHHVDRANGPQEVDRDR